MKYLLDTNSWVDHLRRGPDSKVTTRIIGAPPGSVYLCSMVVGELIYGALHGDPKYQAKNLALVESLRRQYASVAFDDHAAEEYGKIRQDLAAKATPIGPNDLIIGATALANGYTLVTHNTQEFNRVPNLLVEDWQQ